MNIMIKYLNHYLAALYENKIISMIKIKLWKMIMKPCLSNNISDSKEKDADLLL
jgi:hypothetical protein